MLKIISEIIFITLIIALIHFSKKPLKAVARKISFQRNKQLISAVNHVDRKELQNPSIFIGIVDGLEPNNISIGVINVNRQTVSCKSFSLTETALLEIQIFLNEEKSIPELEAISDFLGDQILESEKVQVLMEIPSAILNINSLYLKVLLFLTRRGYCRFELRALEDKKLVQVGFQYFISYNQEEIPITYLVPEEARLTAQIDRGVMYLQKGISKAYAQFLLGSFSFSECAALFAALIAKNKSIYYFFNSEGEVQSSQDLLTFMRDYEEGYPTAVISSNEVFVTLKLPITKQDKIEKIPLKYLIAQKQYKFLGENNALKFALLNICRLWKIRLCCLSWYDKDETNPLNSNANFLIPDADDFSPLSARYVIYEPSEEFGLMESSSLLVSIRNLQKNFLV